MKRYHYTKEEFITAVLESQSLIDVARKLGIVAAGGNYKTMHNKIKEFGLDISHFTGQSYLKGKHHNWGVRMPLSQILIKNSEYSNTNRLRKKLIEEGLFTAECFNCHNILWFGKPIALELHHINGDHNDHRIENLQLLCPNCHALTDNYRGKNK